MYIQIKLMKRVKQLKLHDPKFVSWMSRPTSSLWKEYFVNSKEAHSKNDMLYNGNFFYQELFSNLEVHVQDI